MFHLTRWVVVYSVKAQIPSNFSENSAKNTPKVSRWCNEKKCSRVQKKPAFGRKLLSAICVESNKPLGHKQMNERWCARLNLEKTAGKVLSRAQEEIRAVGSGRSQLETNLDEIQLTALTNHQRPWTWTSFTSRTHFFSLCFDVLGAIRRVSHFSAANQLIVFSPVFNWLYSSLKLIRGLCVKLIFR